MRGASGDSLENRARLLLEVAARLRALLPAEMPLFVRISATDWIEGGWDIEQSVQLAKWLKERGVDLIAGHRTDCAVRKKHEAPLAEEFRLPSKRADQAAPSGRRLSAETSPRPCGFRRAEHPARARQG